jgi:hypothetical protein
MLTLEDLRSAVNAACSCGGGSPRDCCSACEVWHALKDRGLAAAPKSTLGLAARGSIILVGGDPVARERFEAVYGREGSATRAAHTGAPGKSVDTRNDREPEP